MAVSAKLSVQFHVFFLLTVLINALVITLSMKTNGATCMGSERLALLKFKAGLIDEHGQLSTWGAEEDCCKWKGVGCDNQTHHITSLNLRGTWDANFQQQTPLRGNISSALLELVSLSYLDLSNNNFNTIQIPEFLGSVAKLQHLDLSYSNFIGSIPPHLGNLSTLQFLDLRGNYEVSAADIDWLSGCHSLQHLDLGGVNLQNVATWLKPINKLPHLKELHLQGCGLQETLLPSSFPLANTSNALAVLDLDFNRLEISILFWFLNCSSRYSYIDFSDNYLEGNSYLRNLEANPDTWGSMTSLAYLDVSGSMLDGNIPDGLWNLKSISHLDLSSNNLQGGFPHSTGNLSNLVLLQLSNNKLERDLTYMGEFLKKTTMLEYLYLGDNRFHGSVPPLLRSSFLKHLDLSRNELDGSFETRLRLPNLTLLDASENQITGKLPDLSACSSLEIVSLSDNKFDGTMPQTIGNLTKLNSLDLHSNRLTGRLPDLASCSALELLSLSDNKFSGDLNGSIRYLSSLLSLDLHSNDFEGIVSETHFSNLSKLEKLDLSFNSKIRISSSWNPPFQLNTLKLANCNLGPSFPKWLQKQRKISLLDISSSQIYDIVPGWFWDNSNAMDHLNMSYNRMYGTLPNFRSNHTFSILDLRSNEFNGSIPLQPSAQTYLDLSRNKFSGDINDFCNGIHSQVILDLSDNLLSGEISRDCFTNLMMQTYLNLGNNNFSGEISSPISSEALVSRLSSLHLRNNNFRGQVPTSLRDCLGLQILDLGENHFTGNVPAWIGETLSGVVVVSLRSNELTGVLPTNLCLLEYIQILDISLNDISGTIPRCINNFTGMSTIPKSSELMEFLSQVMNHSTYETAYIMWKGKETEYANTLVMVKVIDLSSNNLIGEVPTEITTLGGLMGLNLSRNHLVGTIPRDIGKLDLLNFLDLSHNNLSGSIPTTLAELDHLGVMNLAYNNLSGRIPWNNHLQTFDSSAYAGNPQLCGPPLSDPCPEDQRPQIPASTGPLSEEEDSYVTRGFYMSMAIGFILSFWGMFGTLTYNKSCRIKFSKLLMALEDWWVVKIAMNKNRLQRHFQSG